MPAQAWGGAQVTPGWHQAVFRPVPQGATGEGGLPSAGFNQPSPINGGRGVFTPPGSGMVMPQIGPTAAENNAWADANANSGVPGNANGPLTSGVPFYPQQPINVDRSGPRPQAPAPAPSAPNPAIAQIQDPAPYNRAIDRGNSLIRTIPTNANPLTSFSPAFGGLSKGMQSALGNQWNAAGRGLQDQAGVEFSRKAGSEVPQFMLAQQLGLRGLENDWLDLDNEAYRNQVMRTTGSITPILQMLGAFGSIF